MTIRICPTFDGYFYSALLKALYETYGSRNIHYTCRGFPPLDQRCLAFVIEPSGLKVHIDQIDHPKLKATALEWCDVYSKASVDPALVPPAAAAKVVPSGPTFPVRFCGPVGSIGYAVRNLGLCLPRIKQFKSLKEHFANWWRQYKYRLPETSYAPEPYEPGYVFFSSTIWKTEPECNQYRARFIEVCRSLDWLRFEGGFMPRPNHDVPGFERYTISQQYSHAQYVAKTKQSSIVFNTPSVYGCHPWRTAEFMAFGKAIISTPLLRLMPAPVEHGQHVHFVDGSVESIRDAIDLLFKDADYRQRLERGAREYFLKYLQARSMIDHMLKHAAQLKPEAGISATLKCLNSISGFH